MADRYKCIQGHFTDREHNGKSCPYDKMSSEELSDVARQEIKIAPKYEEKVFSDKEVKRAHIEKVGAYYNLTNKEINAIHKYVNSFDDDWYKKINKQLRDGIPLSKEDEGEIKSFILAVKKMQFLLSFYKNLILKH